MDVNDSAVSVVGEPRLDKTNKIISYFLTPESVVLEVGSNDASFRPFHHQVSKWTTVDKYGNPDLKLDLEDSGLRLPFNDESVDMVICTEVLEHLRTGADLVGEFSRVLKSSGVAIISVPNICSFKSRLKMLVGRLPGLAASGDCGRPLGGTGKFIDGRWMGGHVVDFNDARLEGYLERSGLEITRRVKIQVCVSSLLLPTWAMPYTFGDFLLVVASPKRTAVG